jgi:branched-chain amino acid transport system ATP-binding protein
MAEALLETESLSKRFGALAAVNGVFLRVERGTMHAIIGPNGAGKTTLLSLLSGELSPTAGRVRFRGRDVTRDPPHRLSRLGVGRSYQTAQIFAGASCAECLWLAAQSRLPTSMRFFRPAERYREVAARADAALQLCGLAGRRSERAERLSYGEQRQLEMGMILATEPQLLLLDEPLAGLGHDEAARIVALLSQLKSERTIVLVEHDTDAVFSLADAITVLLDGRVLESGDPRRIRESDAVRDAYLGDEQL